MVFDEIRANKPLKYAVVLAFVALGIAGLAWTHIWELETQNAAQDNAIKLAYNDSAKAQNNVDNLAGILKTL